MNRRVNEIGLLIQAIVAMTRRPPPLRRIVREVFSCGNRSIVFVCVTMAFFGMILVYEGCMQALALIPDLSSAGPATIRSTIRVFGPLMAGLMVSFRVGAGIAAEAGTMVVTEQDGALQLVPTGSAESPEGPLELYFLATEDISGQDIQSPTDTSVIEYLDGQVKSLSPALEYTRRPSAIQTDAGKGAVLVWQATAPNGRKITARVFVVFVRQTAVMLIGMGLQDRVDARNADPTRSGGSRLEAGGS